MPDGGPLPQEMAWESFRDGGIAVGAVLSSGSGEVIGRGRNRWPRVTGPLNGLVGEWAVILPCLNTSGSLVRAMEAVAPRRAELARAVDAASHPAPIP